MPITKITEEEYTAISKLRERFEKKESGAEFIVESRVFTDGFLTRILWVSDMDLDKAEKATMNIAKWRELNGLNQIFTAEFPHLVTDEVKLEFCGWNSDTSPVHFLAPGRMDLKKVMDGGGKSEFIQWFIRITEKIEEDCRQVELANPGHVVTSTLIADYDGFSARQLASIAVIDACLQVTKNFDGNYPLVIGNGALIKVPKIGVVFFNMVTKVLGSKALDKLKLYNSQEKSWKTPLFAKICENCIPTYLGGKYELKNIKIDAPSKS